MKITRRNFLKKWLAGTLLLGTTTFSESSAAFAAASSTSKTMKKKARRVVLIGLDGISVPGFQQAKTPNLDALLSEGVLSLETRVVMPSVTLPNWTSHLTGSGPEQHGVVDNGWTLAKHKLPAIETDADGYYPSVFKVLKDENPQIKTAFYYNWANLIYPYNQKYMDEVSFLTDDAYVPNYEKAFNFLVENRKEPTFVFLYSVHTDEVGHKYEWMSPEYIRSIEEADVEIGKLIEKMKQEDLYEDTHFMFLSDHGGVGRGHGGVSVDEMVVPWGVTGPGIAKGLKMSEPNNTVNTGSLILRLFQVKQPAGWTGEVPQTVFK
ncbi:alkaline phosphatase family protein [Bacteroides sp.]|uniref:alkaline phosphatase family protein n=1 Tax=Bacteroides sp. TaxID=29523 RepID=UPI00261A5295|nr:alkaline phosphatase [Bacteroides sp.]MDD3036558.1 alkaline phosphatase [Bacteroides sp.]